MYDNNMKYALIDL